MKKILLGSVALIGLGMTSAVAADLQPRMYTKAPDYMPAPIYTWTGFYLGGHIGGAFETNDFNGVFVSSSERSSFLGGLQAGADYQFAPNWVLGIEGQYSWTDLNRSGALGTVIVHDNTGGLGSVTGRLGYTWGPGLLYVKGGVGFRDRDVTGSIGGVPFVVASNNNDTGYTVGAGLEYMFAPNWSTKLEYQYYNFDNTSFTVPTTPAMLVDFNRDIHTVKLGINYRFNWGGPVVTRY